MAENVQTSETQQQAADSGMSAILDEIRTTVADQVTQAVEPIQQRQDSLDETLRQFQASRQGQSRSGETGESLFGVRTGEDPMTSRGYSFARLFEGLATRDFSSAKVEIGIHEKLHQAYGGNTKPGSVLAPLGSEFLAFDDVGRDLAMECRQAVQQGVSGADLGEFRDVAQRQLVALQGRRVNQDLSIYDDTAGGVFLGSIQQGEMIDLLRAREFFSNAGAREFAFPTNGRMQWPKQTAGMTGYWVGEGQTITESDITTGLLNMAAKKLAALTDLPNELLRFATFGVEAFIRMEIAKTLALKLDNSLISATGSEVEPKGLINYSGINTVTASTTGAAGDTLQPEDIENAVATVEEADVPVDQFTFGLRPLMWAKVKNRRADAVSANDGKGPYLFAAEGPASLQRPGSLMGYDVIKTTQIPNDRVKGAGTNLTMVLGGNFSEYLIGRAGVIEFMLNPFTQTNYRNDLTSIRGIQHVDGRPRRESAFVMIDDLVYA